MPAPPSLKYATPTPGLTVQSPPPSPSSSFFNPPVPVYPTPSRLMQQQQQQQQQLEQQKAPSLPAVPKPRVSVQFQPGGSMPLLPSVSTPSVASDTFCAGSPRFGFDNKTKPAATAISVGPPFAVSVPLPGLVPAQIPPPISPGLGGGGDFNHGKGVKAAMATGIGPPPIPRTSPKYPQLAPQFPSVPPPAPAIQPSVTVEKEPLEKEKKKKGKESIDIGSPTNLVLQMGISETTNDIEGLSPAIRDILKENAVSKKVIMANARLLSYLLNMSHQYAGPQPIPLEKIEEISETLKKLISDPHYEVDSKKKKEKLQIGSPQKFSYMMGMSANDDDINGLSPMIKDVLKKNGLEKKDLYAEQELLMFLMDISSRYSDPKEELPPDVLMDFKRLVGAAMNRKAERRAKKNAAKKDRDGLGPFGDGGSSSGGGGGRLRRCYEAMYDYGGSDGAVSFRAGDILYVPDDNSRYVGGDPAWVLLEDTHGQQSLYPVSYLTKNFSILY